MAQALNIPMRSRMAALGSIDPEPSRLPIVQIASSGQSGPFEPSCSDMGQSWDLFKRARHGADTPETVRFPGPAIDQG